jgi:parafibromin
LYLAWVLKDAAVAEYMKQARENALAHGFVGITERKKVVDWLEGRGGIEEGRIQQGRATLSRPHRLMFLNNCNRRLSG